MKKKQSKHSKLAQRYNTLVNLAQCEESNIKIIKGGLTHLIKSQISEESIDNKKRIEDMIKGQKSVLNTHRIIYNAYMHDINLTKRMIKDIQSQNSSKIK